MEGLLQVPFNQMWKFYIPCSHVGGPRKVLHKWSQDKNLFESWRDGRTGYPLIDANMKELSTTGFMSNRGRQIGAWEQNGLRHAFWIMTHVPIMGIGLMDQELGMIPEKTVISAYLNKHGHDPEGEYVAYWLPELRTIPKDKRHFPGNLYIRQIVLLRFGTAGKHHKEDKPLGATRPSHRGREARSIRRQFG